jgi:hypothetical protein
MHDFWIASGHHLVDRSEAGGLVLTDTLLKAWLARPELVPPEEACDAERALHTMLLADPLRPITEAVVAPLADADARENFTVFGAFRDRLLGAASLEAAYNDFARNGAHGTPPIFLQQLAQLCLRNALDGVDDVFTLRAAELFFRPQVATVHEGHLLLADAEVLADRRAKARPGAIALLAGTAPTIVDLDVLTEDNADLWWHRSDRHDFVLDFGLGKPGRDGFARAIERFLRHMLGVVVNVDPVAEITDDAWRWFVGLDAEATRLGNALWQGQDLADEARARIIALFRLSFADDTRVLERVSGRPVWLLLARDAENRVIVKPQNLLVGLPLAQDRAA